MMEDEFSGYTPKEFSAIWEAWQERAESRSRGAWERMRLLATISIQPHIKDKVTPPDLIPLPWDDETDEEPEITPEERRRLAEAALRKFG